MPVSIVDPTSTLLRHLASVDVKFSGIHIGGGVYFSANHFPSPGGTSKAIPGRSLDTEGEQHNTTEYDFTLPDGDPPWNDYRDDTNGDGTPDAVKQGYDISLHVGDRLLSGDYYDGASVPLLIANDFTDLTGSVHITGYPGSAVSLDGQEGTLHESSGTISGWTSQSVNGDEAGYFTVSGAEVLTGMSGAGTFLEWDPDGDGVTQTFAIGTVSRAGVIDYPDPLPDEYIAEIASFSQQYHDLAAALEALPGDALRTADDFARMTLLSAQTLGSSLTTVTGTFFHENIFGGANADTLKGFGGNDLIEGAEGADLLEGGDGADTLSGGAGNDTLDGGAGADVFDGAGFGGGATDKITDFDAAEDVLDLSLFFASFDDVLAAATDNPDGSTTINLALGSEPPAAAGGSVVLMSMTKTQLTGSNVSVACFTPGIRVATAEGITLIERLRAGDRVWTRDHGLQPVKRIASEVLSPATLRREPRLRPVLIRKGALGDGIPGCDLRVSPQHRILVSGPIVHRMACTEEALIPANKLLPLPGVRQDRPDAPVVYIHLEFERHEILWAEGCLTESWYDGALVGGAGRMTPARTLLKETRARNLVLRHRKNSKPLQSNSNGTDALLPQASPV